MFLIEQCCIHISDLKYIYKYSSLTEIHIEGKLIGVY